jgi:hypothetical protein
MGLNTSHGCFDGSYSSFGRFRDLLAEQIGINLRKDYIGYGNENATLNLQDIQHDLMPLFDHSDCDGELSVAESQRIADGLDQILANLRPLESPMEEQFFITKIKKFRDGCRLAVSKNQIVEFH